MTRPSVAALAALGLVFAVVAPGPAQQPAISPAPVPGPVGLSVGNEARTAVLRAERWLRRNAPDDEDIRPPLPAAEPADDGELARLLPLLQGQTPTPVPGGLPSNRYEDMGRLASALAHRGDAWVFLSDGTSIPWRNALLHDLAATQRPDDRGGGWWCTLPADDPASSGDAVRSTRAALAAILFLLGEPSP